MNSEYQDIFINNYKDITGSLKDTLIDKVNFHSLCENYKLPLDLIEEYKRHFRLTTLLKNQILNVEEIVRLFKIYEVSVDDVQDYYFELFVHQLPNIDSDIVERIEMMLELTELN